PGAHNPLVVPEHLPIPGDISPSHQQSGILARNVSVFEEITPPWSPSVCRPAFIDVSGASLEGAVRVSSGGLFPGVAAARPPSAHDMRHDRATTSAVRGGVSEHPGIPTALKRQPLRPN